MLLQLLLVTLAEFKNRAANEERELSYKECREVQRAAGEAESRGPERRLGSDGVSCSVVSDSLRPHGL